MKNLVQVTYIIGRMKQETSHKIGYLEKHPIKRENSQKCSKFGEKTLNLDTLSEKLEFY